jgi:hypothetical protein
VSGNQTLRVRTAAKARAPITLRAGLRDTTDDEQPQRSGPDTQPDEPLIQTSHETAEATTTDLLSNLSEPACEILCGLYRYRAFDMDRSASLSDVAQRQNINDGTLRKHVARLKELRLVDTKEGRGGGCRLIPAGREFVEETLL